ncbi:DUF4843 domain-containing protein [Pedobacter sp. KACC 23697]|uniref:DUF4843 domain-containing protein n=1 Tax=Pedobacter sp. KACC 23697 TaxID=3149230 RepID=A0AAU7K8J5_9SPHI
MKYLTILFLLVFAIGCKKDDIPTFEGRDGISFFIDYYENPDSTNYSFALQPTAKTKDTIFIKMRLVGKPSSVARGIKLKALPGSTARPNIDYILPEVKLPANALFVNYPLVIFNTPEMLTQNFQLVLGVDPGSELVPGAPGIAVDLSKNLSKMKVNITNQLIEPDYWQNLSFFFGNFSVVKFKFMIKVTGLTNFDPQVVGFSDIFLIQVNLKKALSDYVQLNGPLIDEFGNQITF